MAVRVSDYGWVYSETTISMSPRLRSAVRNLFVPKPSEIRTQVWDDLHARLPWIQGGDDPLIRLVVGVEIHSKDPGLE